jgi:hypothetical protein
MIWQQRAAALADAQLISDGPAHRQPGYGYLTAAGAPRSRPDPEPPAGGPPAGAGEAAALVTAAHAAGLFTRDEARDFLSRHPEYCDGHPVTAVLERMAEAAGASRDRQIELARWDAGQSAPPEIVIMTETVPAPEPALSGALFGDAAELLAELMTRPVTLDEVTLPQYGTVYPGHCSGCLLPGTWRDGKCWYCLRAAALRQHQETAGPGRRGCGECRRLRTGMHAALWIIFSALAVTGLICLLIAAASAWGGH